MNDRQDKRQGGAPTDQKPVDETSAPAAHGRSEDGAQTGKTDATTEHHSTDERPAQAIGFDPLFDDVEDLRGSLSFEPGHTPVDELSVDPSKDNAEEQSTGADRPPGSEEDKS